MGGFNEANVHRDSQGRFTSGPSIGTVLAGVVVVIGILAVIAQGGGAPAAGTPQKWSHAGLSFTQQEEDQQKSCSKLSYGAVHRWLASHPCAGLHRALYDGGSDGGIAVTVSTVRMSSAARAAQLKALTDRSGTGNITELGRDYVIPTRDLGRYYASSVSGNTVTISQAASSFLGTASSAQLRKAAAAGLHAPK